MPLGRYARRRHRAQIDADIDPPMPDHQDTLSFHHAAAFSVTKPCSSMTCGAPLPSMTLSTLPELVSAVSPGYLLQPIPTSSNPRILPRAAPRARGQTLQRSWLRCNRRNLSRNESTGRITTQPCCWALSSARASSDASCSSSDSTWLCHAWGQWQDTAQQFPKP